MKDLYFIRHAESVANSTRVLASHLPYPVTDAGREDSRRIAGEFRTTIPSLGRIISSPLLRAVQTAEAFRDAFGTPIETDHRLSEQHLGPFTGMSYDAVKTEPGYENDTLARWNWIPGGVGGGGESYAMVAGRVVDFLNWISEEPESGPVLVVTHAVVFRVLRGALENTLPAYPVKFPNNGEIWKVKFSGLGKKHEIESLLLGNSREFTHNP